MSMPTHEASRFFEREDPKYDEKKPFARVITESRSSPSIINQPKDLCRAQCLSFTTPSPSICTQSGHLYPWSKNQSKNLYDPQQCSFARFTAEESSASPCAQPRDCHPLAWWPASKISWVSRILRTSNSQINMSMNKQ